MLQMFSMYAFKMFSYAYDRILKTSHNIDSIVDRWHQNTLPNSTAIAVLEKPTNNRRFTL